MISYYIFQKPQKAVCQYFGLFPMHGLSFKARRSKLCMQPPFMRALVLGRSRPASAASEAVSWYVLFGVSKNHRRTRFLGSWLKSKVAQRPRFRGTGWPQIRPTRSSEAKNGKNRDFRQLEGWSLLHTSRPPLEAVRGCNLNPTSEVTKLFNELCQYVQNTLFWILFLRYNFGHLYVDFEESAHHFL